MKRIVLAVALLLASASVQSQTKMYIHTSSGIDSVWLSDIKNITFKTYVPPADDTLMQDMIAYYPFDGTEADASGHGKNGTASGNYRYVEGRRGQAIGLVGDNLTFYTTGGHVRIPPIDTTRLTELTISLWVKEDSASQGDGYIYLSSDCDQGWCGIGHFGPYVQYAVGADTYSKQPLNTQFDPTARGQWTLYTLVYAEGEMKAYINGRFASAKAQPLLIYGSHAWIGAHEWGGPWAGYSTRFTGAIDDVRIYKRALAEWEIELLYQSE